MSDTNPANQLRQLSTERLLESARRRFWGCLEGDQTARVTFQAIHEELEGRGGKVLANRPAFTAVKTVMSALRRLEGSLTFKNAPLLQRLLRTIVRHTLLTGTAIKQASLAIQVWGTRNAAKKGAGAVSTEMGRLRDAIDAYYEGPGLGDPIRIRIPTGRGRYIAIIRRLAPPTSEDFVREATGERESRLQVVPLNGLRGISAFPAFSPAGDAIAFCWNHDQGGYNLDLFVQSVTSASPVQITASAGTADISPAWSPDGHELAFVRVSLGRSELRVTTPQPGNQERKIVDVFAARYDVLGRHLVWCPDGGAVVIADKKASDQPFAIVRIDLASGMKEEVTHPPAGIVGDSDPTFAPDGRALAFVRCTAIGVKDVFVLPRGSRDPVRLTFDDKNVYGMSWLPDSRGLIFSSARAGVPGLWKIGLGGDPPERVPGVGDPALHPACSAAGDQLAYTNLAVSTSIWEVPLAERGQSTGRERRFISSTRNDVNPDFSPDGSQIAFASDRSGTFEIWIADANGTNARKVTSFNSSSGAGSPRWSPDGSRLVFDCRVAGNGHVYILTLETDRLQRLTRGPAENVVPSWSRDGRYLYFSSNRSGQHQIWRMTPDGKGALQITQSGGFAPIESPNGEFLYYAKGRTAPGLWRVRAEGGEHELALETLKPTFWGLWAVNAEGLYYLDSAPNGPPPCTLNFFEFRARATKKLMPLNGIKRVHYQGLAISPDGTRLLYPQLEESAGEILLARYAF
jgi:Tol biopolymer transport system component